MASPALLIALLAGLAVSVAGVTCPAPVTSNSASTIYAAALLGNFSASSAASCTYLCCLMSASMCTSWDYTSSTGVCQLAHVQPARRLGRDSALARRLPEAFPLYYTAGDVHATWSSPQVAAACCPSPTATATSSPTATATTTATATASASSTPTPSATQSSTATKSRGPLDAGL